VADEIRGKPWRARALRALATHYAMLMYLPKENFVKEILEKLKPKMKEIIKDVTEELRKLNPTVDESTAPVLAMLALLLVQSEAEVIAEKYQAQDSEPFFHWLTIFLAEVMLGLNDANCYRYMVIEAQQGTPYEKSFVTASEEGEKMYA